MSIQDSDSVTTLFSLLRSGLYGTPIPEQELPGSIDWNAVVRLAQRHVVLGTVIDSIQHLPERLRPTGKTLAGMNRFALSLIHANLVMDRTVTRLATFLKEQGIEGALLKGQGVARYYRQPQMRQSGDIDYYVGRKLYKKALSLCREHLMKDRDSYSKTEQHFEFDLDGIPIEVHRVASRMFAPWNNMRFQKWATEELEQSADRRTLTLGNTDVTLPSYDFDAVFIFHHAWRHFISGGIGLRQLCDWAMIFHTHSDDIDPKKLEKTITRLGLAKGWKLFACIAVRHLGVAEHKIPLYDPTYVEKSEKILEDVLAGGNFGYYSETFMRAMRHKSFIGRGLGKVRAVTSYFVSLFPLIPVEATCLYFNRLVFGTIDFSKRSMHKPVE